ncbi:MAG: sigma 54-interacting transcriptional regulator [Acidiphilium sp.]|nr:sigma 54-interacting transcriptional regulator [Acidiphilium sp.]MDD4935858.1 sigma 54-interacting transcriptional regulator [Acidiphilium sp.]
MTVTVSTGPAQANLIGESVAFRAMLTHVSDLAPIDRPVLVIGERGTGKELVASRLALLSARWNQPLLQLNCAALSESLLDSELFGHEAGAFTGAARRRASRFELADHGTLFLDEIANASLAVQEKLLRVIEYGVFERVGGNEPVHVDVRVIAATHEDLPALVSAKKFRADLLDRLAFDVIRIPPLRERGEDVLHLAQHFAQRMTSELGRDFFAGFAPAAQDALLAHDWPGNVRELRNVVERSLYREADWRVPLAQIRLDPFGRPPIAPDDAASLKAVLVAHRHNQRRTAAALGITYDQLRHRLRRLGLLAAKAG